MFNTISYVVLCFDFYVVSSFLYTNDQFVAAKDTFAKFIKEKASVAASHIPRYSEDGHEKQE